MLLAILIISLVVIGVLVVTWVLYYGLDMFINKIHSR